MAQDSPLFLSMWNWDPITLAGGILLVAIYLGVEFVYRPKVEASKKVSLPGTACFIAGILIAVLLRVSPLDELSDKYLLIPHMITHLTLSNVIAPLLVLGMPGWWFSRILRIPFWKKAGQGLTAPALAFMLFNINLLGWHYPPIYEAAMANESIHLLEHAAFLVTGLMFWWPILNRACLPLTRFYTCSSHPCHAPSWGSCWSLGRFCIPAILTPRGSPALTQPQTRPYPGY